MEFTESGMTFSFSDSDLFHIETCPTYRDLAYGTKICECIVKQTAANRIFLLEAKTSFSNPANNDGKNFDENVNEIVQKFLNSIVLYFGLLLNRPFNAKSELPDNLKLSEFLSKQYTIKPLLIISNFEESWLPQVQDALNYSLKHYSFSKFIVLEDVIVLNKEMAKIKKIIKS